MAIGLALSDSAPIAERSPPHPLGTRYYGTAKSGNLRDRHMVETLEAVLGARGPDARAVVWAHNSNSGDATATEMGKVRG